MSEAAVTVLGWVIPRPTGRWHQSVVVTNRHVWITPELTFGSNTELRSAATDGLDAFHDYVRGAGWKARPQRLHLHEVRGIAWDDTTGWLRIADADKEVIGAMIPDRELGTKLAPRLKVAVSTHLGASPA